MNSYKKLLKNSTIFAIANLGTKLMTIILVPFYTFVLTTKEYGEVDLIVTTISLVIPIITLSIFESVLRFAMDKNEDKEKVFTSAVIIMLIGFICSAIFLPFFRYVPGIKDYIVLFYLIMVTQGIHMLLSNFVRAIGKVKLFAIDGVINTAILLISNIILLSVFKWGIYGYLVSILLSHIVSCILLMVKGKGISSFKMKKYDKVLAKNMLRYSIPLIPNSLMWWVMNVSDRYVITLFISASANGLYAVANKIPSLLNILNNIFFQAWQLSAIEESDSETKSLFYSNIFNMFSTLMLVATSFILIIIKPAIRFVVAQEYSECWKFVPFLLLGIVFSSFSGFLGTNYIAMKKTNGILKSSFLGALINIILNLLLVPKIGVNGAAIATMISFLFVWIYRIFDTEEYVDIKIDIKKFTYTFLIIITQIGILFSNIKLEIILQCICLIIMILINYKTIYKMIKNVKK